MVNPVMFRMTKRVKWTIYCHVHRESGRRYVGLTRLTMLRRWNSHVYDALKRRRGKSHFHNAIWKYGKDAFDHEVLEACSSLEEANEREQFWIGLYDTTNPVHGFNLARGGGHVPSPVRKNPWDDPGYLWNDPDYRREHGRKMREVVNRPDVRAKRMAGLHAFLQSPDGREWREKLRRINLGRPLSMEHREALAESSSRVQREVPGHVSCGRHGLVPFGECFRAKSRTGRVLHRCKHCILDRSRAKLRRLAADGLCIACKSSAADAGTRCRRCADRRLQSLTP